jgi:hypothetical protein
MSAQLIVWEMLCAGLLWSVFCRLVRTSTLTRLSVRFSIFGLGCASLVGLGAPLYGWQPDVVVFVMAGACLNMQLVAARHWRKGVPEQFQASVFNLQREG